MTYTDSHTSIINTQDTNTAVTAICGVAVEFCFVRITEVRIVTNDIHIHVLVIGPLFLQENTNH